MNPLLFWSSLQLPNAAPVAAAGATGGDQVFAACAGDGTVASTGEG
ncbi:MAG: hypothetical protein KGJ62_15410 [Armatimonadetes bacterium]|nr:hypothetical protein [Armatimonadota bacterium]MDE2207489.1 hypothetical protein [Armatimonadota bacterium]